MRTHVRSAAVFVSAIFAMGTVPAMAQVPQVPITVQVINDSGLPDSSVFLLLAGKSIPAKVNGAAYTYPFMVQGVNSVDLDTATAVSPATGGPLLCPPASGPSCVGLALAQAAGGGQLTVNSPYSGAQGLPVYSFTMTTVGSGTLYFSSPAALTMPPAPTVTSPLRFQPLEFSYSSAIISNGDLTSIDFYGTPLQLETYGPGDSSFLRPQNRVTYYSSTPTILNAFLTASPNLSAAFWGQNGQPFAYSSGSFNANLFARIVGPNQVAAQWSGNAPVFYPTGSAPAGWPAGAAWPPTGSAGVPWPYPSFAGYLGQLAASKYTFTETDNRNISAYTFSYTGSIYPMTATTADSCLPASAAAAGWYIKLTGTTSGAAPLPDSMDICIPLPTFGTAPSGVSPGSSSGDFYIYGAAQNCESLILASDKVIQPCHDADAVQAGAIANSVYGWIQADVLSALNFGYMQGRGDTLYGGGSSAMWYGNPPAQYPFGAARISNDGFYNPWAAVMYNHSDAYGFAFSDRKGRPSPDIDFPIGGTLRIWILPDVRLDAPLARVASTSSTEVRLSWPRVSGADHYEVRWSPAVGGSQPQLVAQPPRGGVAVAKVGTLNSGTEYQFMVRAASADGTRHSTEVPVHATTQGPQPSAAAGNATFDFGFNWTPPTYLGAVPELWVADIQATYGVDARGKGSYAIAGLPIIVGPPASSANLTVLPASAAPPGVYITETVTPNVVAPGAPATLIVTINNPLSTSLSMDLGYSMQLPANLVVALDTSGPTACPGAVVNAGNVIQIGASTIINNSSCSITATLTSSTSGTVLIPAPALQNKPTGALAPVLVANGGAAALTVAGGPASAITQTIVPAIITAGDATGATLTLTLAGADAAQPLLQSFVDELPVGVSVGALQSGGTTCPAVSVDATSSLIAMPKGTLIPAGGCSIVATIIASTAGSVTNTTDPLLTDAAAYPTQIYPIMLRMPSCVAKQPCTAKQPGAVLWASNLYLTFLGSAWNYSVGPCLPTDECIGGSPTVLPGTVPFDTMLAPNFLQRQDPATGLTVAGGAIPIGAPFGTAMPSIGVSFTPVPDKRIAPVAIPSP